MRIHVSEEFDERDRGFAFGAANAEQVRHTVSVYRQLCDLSAGGRVRASDDEHEEIQGIAMGAGVNVRELLAVNARTELMASVDECSVAASDAILAQNWDWHPDLQASALVWIVRDGERWFATLTEAGILAKIGLNDAGLGVCLNALTASEDGGLDGTPIHLLLRRVLTCRSVEEAVALLTAARVSASSAVTVAEPGNVLTVELSPGGANVVAGGTHTSDGRDGVLEALRSHCRHVDESLPWAERTATLASVIMDLDAKRLHVAAGQPCTTPHVEVELSTSPASSSSLSR